MTTGILPMRDTALSSPHVAEDFAAQTGLARLLVRHDSLRRGDDGDPEASQDRGNRVGPSVDPPPRTGDALDSHHDGLALGVVLESDAQDRAPPLLNLAEGGED